MSDQLMTLPVGKADHVLGDDAAEVILVEYGDFECPYCGAAYPVLKRVMERMGARVRFVFRSFPLAQVHPHAEHAAEAAESVAAHAGTDAFWAMHDLLFEHQHSLDDHDLARYAARAGAKEAMLIQDLDDGTFEDVVRASFMGGVRSGVNGTPTLFIDGIRYDGPRDEDTLVAALTLVAESAESDS